MRRLIALLALTALTSCLPTDENTGGPQPPPEVRAPDPDTVDEADPREAFTRAWDLVMIIDAPLEACDPDGPGADIDAVELHRDGVLVGWAASVAAVEDVHGPYCVEATASVGVPGETLGEADGHFEDGDHEGIFSLNGATLYLELSEPMENGDTLVVHELDPADEAEEDCIQVYLGYVSEDGDMAFTDQAIQDWTKPPGWPNSGCETLTIPVDGLW